METKNIEHFNSEEELGGQVEHRERSETPVMYIKGARIYTITQDMCTYSGLFKTLFDDIKGDYGTTKQRPINILKHDEICMEFVLAYINKCVRAGEEQDPPSKPLSDLHLNYILGDEFELFNSVFDMGDYPNNFKSIYKYFITAEYLRCDKLCSKLAAVMAYILMNQEMPLTEVIE